LIKSIIKYLFLLLLIGNSCFGQNNDKKLQIPKTRILFIFDASQSMYGFWDKSRKIKIARDVLKRMVDSLDNLENVQLGLRVYGHQSEVPPQDCNDTRLEVPFAPNNGSKIKHKLNYIRAKGTTPIAHSLEQAQHDFPECKQCRNIIILITDGREACEGDPCAVSNELQKKGIILKPFVIGIGLDPNFKHTFECVGDFYNTPSKDKFKHALDVVITKILNTTTAQVNLLDDYGKPSETNVGMTFYDHLSEKVLYNFVHTLNYKGNPDTLTLDPLVTYDLVVHTLPEVRKDSITLNPGKHNMIGLDAPQGMLNLKCPNSNQYRNLKFLIKEKGSHQLLNVQKINEIEKYIVGKYDIEVLTVPRISLKDVEIRQSHTTKIKIPQPGILNILREGSGYGSLFQKKDNNKLKWILNFSPNHEKQSLILQPGEYEITYRPKNIKNTMFTRRKSFIVKSGSSTTITLD